MSMNERDYILSEIKTNARILNTWGNTIVPALNGKETTAMERLTHFVERAKTELGMSVEEIDAAIA